MDLAQERRDGQTTSIARMLAGCRGTRDFAMPARPGGNLDPPPAATDHSTDAVD
jgi:hypothetical protein